MTPTHRRPTTPGEILREDFLSPKGLSSKGIAALMGVPTNRITQILAGRHAVTADTALRLAEVLETTPEFWLNLQMNVDLWDARKRIARERRKEKSP